MKSNKIMKSLSILACTFALGTISITNTTSAAEAPESTAYETFTENQEKREQHQERLMDIILQYAPEMSEDFTDAFALHNQIHEDLFTAKTQYVQERLAQQKAELAILKEELLDQVAQGLISRQEMLTQLREFVESEHNERKSYLESIKETAKVYQEQYGNDPDAVKALHKALKEAAKAGNSEEIKPLLEEIYSVLQIHLDVDRYRLSLWTIQ